jgi:Holliday junction resolvase
MDANSTANARLKDVFMGATYNTFSNEAKEGRNRKIRSHEEKIQGVVSLVETFPNRKKHPVLRAKLLDS